MKFRKLRYFIVLAFFIISHELCASDYRFESFQPSMGVSSNLCTASIVDKLGFHWLGTNSGLYRYGVDVQKISLPKSQNNLVNDIKIVALDIDDEGFIWVGAKSAVFRVNSISFQVEKINFPETSVPNLTSSINDVLVGPNDSVYVATRNGLLKCNREKDKLYFDSRFPHIEKKRDSVSKSKRVITDLMFDSLERLWVSTDGGGVRVYNKSGAPFLTFDTQQLGSNSIFSMYEDFDQHVWLAKSRGAVCLDKSFTPLKNIEKLFSDFRINCFYSDRVNDVLIGTDKGVFKYESHNGHFSVIENAGDKELSINNNGVIYIGGWASNQFIIGSRLGVFGMIKTNFNFDTYSFNTPTPMSLSGNLLRAVVQDPRNRKYQWIATYNDGVDLLNSRTSIITPIPFDKKISSSITSLHCTMVDFHKNIFFGSNNGILRLNKKERVLYRSKFYGLPISNESIYAMLHSTSGDYWVVGMSSGLIRYNPQTHLFNSYCKSDEKGYIPTRNIKTLFQSSNGSIWVGTHIKGIYKYDSNQDLFTCYSTKNGSTNLVSDKIFCFYEDSRGVLWVGTGKGLAYYDPVNDSFKPFESDRFAINMLVLSIQEDSSGRMWLGTNDGIKCLDQEKETCSEFFVQDGLQSNVFEYNVSTKNKNYIFMGGNNGLNRFDPSKFKTSKRDAKVVITRVQCLDKEGNKTEFANHHLYKMTGGYQNVQLSPEIEKISLTLSVTNEFDQTKSHFAYKFEGDSLWTWNKDATDKITLEIPSERKFSIYFKASNSHGIVSKKKIVIHFFKARSYMMLFLVPLILILVVTIVKYFLSRKSERKIEVNTSVSNIFSPLQNTHVPSEVAEKAIESEIELEGKQIKEALEKNMWYLDRNLNKHLFAHHLQISMSHLSLVLREGLKMSFNDLINSYRVDEVKKRLKDPSFKDYTLLGIAEDCGFNSKTSFYRIFKKFTGITPSEFIQDPNIDEE
ncbi:helix-turn-helix domain-containing protein [Halosquirtibacter laminarini]|uniref:Helix-turn-helix domain-containing protein n=1 Tax=Halosquirtibacter laminarini TaxID=3374600 RepID=A0AC61NL81_9BACT|nr:helix-turn-helix domain-containing protein [Prolixibacteraceae bacterium]